MGSIHNDISMTNGHSEGHEEWLLYDDALEWPLGANDGSRIGGCRNDNHWGLGMPLLRVGDKCLVDRPTGMRGRLLGLDCIIN